MRIEKIRIVQSTKGKDIVWVDDESPLRLKEWPKSLELSWDNGNTAWVNLENIVAYEVTSYKEPRIENIK